ncbi:hypothetical protein CNR22_12755 [Sphingobacteriaceae bacterium]|nr:hypothetical protein CNR22_12755 [Sphingobacteriaceae bacterium]
MKLKTSSLIKQALELVSASRGHVVRQTNGLMVFTYFQLGRLIVEHEQQGTKRAAYGKEVIVQTSDRLTSRFGKGFSVDNLENMRNFYEVFRYKFTDSVISETVSRKSPSIGKVRGMPAKILISETLSRKSFTEIFPLSWSHYVLLCKIKNQQERSFYEIETIQGHWSVRELQRQFDGSLFERLALSKNKKKVRELAKKGQIIEKPEDILKSSYVLEFLGLESKSSYTETDLETAIINKIETFLIEMGKGFLFQGRQIRFLFDGDEFIVDLVLYNRLLQCFVLVDLKIGKLRHEDIGQMQMYVNYYDRYVKTEKEKPTIGIIICKNKSDAVIEITLPKNNKTIFAKEYKLYLPSKADLVNLVNEPTEYYTNKTT